MIRLAIDVGTSNTVAVLDQPGGAARPLLFDGSPQLPSAVFADTDGVLLTGRDALHQARTRPERLAAHPKRHVDEATVLLGTAEPAVPELIGAILRRVRDEAVRVAGRTVDEVILTHPASWGAYRRGVLTAAAELAGLSTPVLVPEPVAAAFGFRTGAEPAPGACVVVYDFGAGTFDASVVRREPDGRYAVLTSTGLGDVGGLDLDALIVDHLLADHPERNRLDRPGSAADRRTRTLFWDDVRSAKEALSRTSATFVQVPLLEVDVPLRRAEFEHLARPLLDRTVAATAAVIRDAGVAVSELAGVFLVGGASRTPFAATLLHRALGVPPVVIDQPELVVAHGALRAPRTGVGLTVTRQMPVLDPASDPDPDPARTPSKVRTPAVRLPVRSAAVALVAALVVVGVVGAAYGSRAWLADRFGRPVPATSAPASAVSGPAAAVPGFPAALAGRWAGRMLQSDNRTVAVRVQIVAGSPVAAVAYPDLHCTGALTVVSAADGRLTVRESILSGPCTPAGSLTLTPTGDGLSFLYQPDDNGYSGSGFLKRG